MASKINVNDKSPALQLKPEARTAGEPVKIEAEEHKGYERETAPSSTEIKSSAAHNRVKSTKTVLSPVSKEGSKSALLNKKDGFGAGNDKSLTNPVSSAMPKK